MSSTTTTSMNDGLRVRDMGSYMAANLARRYPMTVWNRTQDARELVELGARRRPARHSPIQRHHLQCGRLSNIEVSLANWVAKCHEVACRRLFDHRPTEPRFREQIG